MTDKSFIHLHVHTEFSLLDGLSRISKLVNRAKELEMPALAITDHGTMFGVMDFFNKATNAGIKPIIGVETYLAPRTMNDRDPKLDKRPYHMLLLAKNEIGYKNLLKISSEGQLRGYYYRPRVDMEFLASHSEGIIATTGCLAAKIPSMLMAGREDDARQAIGEFVDIFGSENFYLEVQQHQIEELEPVNKWLVEYNASNHTNVGLLATNDTHYVLKEDADAHDTLLCIQTSALKNESNRMRLSDASYHLASSQEMWDSFGHVPEAIHNSRKIAEMCEIDLSRKGYHLPVFPVPEKYDATTYLRHLCELGLKWRFGSRATDEVLVKRLDRELGIIHNMGFETYFLIVWDLCEYARHVDIWWNVRGSGAGSLAAYCLGITNIDPIQNNLLFERFLNPGRVSMPDIDLDYPDDRRGEMIAYTAMKYGEDKVAAIITFGTMGPKAAVRDVGRTLEVALADVNKAAGLIPQEARPKKLEEYVESIADLQKLYDTDAKIKEIIDTAKELQGVSRHASTHAAGVIVADKPLVEYLPLHRITGKDPSGGALKAVTQFPMETCESIGLLKVDFLGLSTLTILRKACDLIEQYHGIKYTMDNIPYRHDDPKLSPKDIDDLDAAFKMMGRGETVGVFQVESSGMQQMLRDMRPKRFENIIAAVSLYRPGPMEFIPQYNRRLREEEEVTYTHALLEDILAETYGIIVYQEQIMQIAGKLFDYELGEADLMRKAVSKKKQKDLVTHRTIFLERGPQNGVDEDAANKIFDEIEFFANYGFNKAHASDYAVITVQTAFLKAHYPAEYMTALLSVHRDDSAKISHFLEECRRLQIPILPPDVNHSMLDFDIQLDSITQRRGIRFGLAAIKNAGEGSLQSIIDSRLKDDLFKNLNDFCERIDLRAVGKRTLESLIKVGALHDFGNRSQLVSSVDRLVTHSTKHHRDKEVGQMNLFGDSLGFNDDVLETLPEHEEIALREMLAWEKELLGLYVTGRPADKYREVLTHSGSIEIQEMKQDPTAYAGKEVQVAGEIVALRRIYTKNNEAMCVIQIEDWHPSTGSIEVVLFPRTWKIVVDWLESGELKEFEEGSIIQIFGKLDTQRGEPQIIATKVNQKFDVAMAENVTPRLDDNSVPLWAQDDPRTMSSTSSVEPPAWVYADEEPQTYSNTPPAWAVDDDENVFDEETGEVSQPAQEIQPEVVMEIAPATQGGVAMITPAVEPQFVSTLAPETNGNGYHHNGKGNGNGHHKIHPMDMDSEVPQPNPVLVRVYFPRSNDDNHDRRRLKRLHGLLIKYPGQDRFNIIIEDHENDRALTLEYPNHTTGYCEDLFLDLLSVVESKQNIEIYELAH